MQFWKPVPAKWWVLCLMPVLQVHKECSGKGRIGIRWERARSHGTHRLEPEAMRTDETLCGSLLNTASLPHW